MNENVPDIVIERGEETPYNYRTGLPQIKWIDRNTPRVSDVLPFLNTVCDTDILTTTTEKWAVNLHFHDKYIVGSKFHKIAAHVVAKDLYDHSIDYIIIGADAYPSYFKPYFVWERADESKLNLNHHYTLLKRQAVI